MRSRNIKEVLEFVSEQEKDVSEEEKTTFLLRKLTRGVLISAEETIDAKSVAKDPAAAGRARIRILRSSIIGWKNFKDESGAEVAFRIDSDGLISQECLDLIFIDIQNEIWWILLADTTLSAAKKKLSA